MPSDPVSSSVLERFRSAYLKDVEASSVRPLAEYLARFPGDDVGLAVEYAALHRARRPEGASDPLATKGAGGQRVGPYLVLREVGRGGQGVVYLAEDVRLHRKVALKVLTGFGPGSESSMNRFRREAEVASKLAHPGICGIHDAGVADGVPYIAMNFVEGTTLAERIAASKRSGDATAADWGATFEDAALPETAAKPRATPSPSATSSDRQEIAKLLRIFEKAACALHAAHEAGVVHRDVKPGNIMVTAAGDPVILDFGLAHAEDADIMTLTKTGDVFGTPAYMSPEQISGQRVRLDRRSDVYSLGVTLYECLTLSRPFDAPTREAVFQAVMTKAPPPPRRLNPAISKDLSVVLETALEKDRDRRYATAEAFAQDLLAVIEGRPIRARPVGPIGRFVRWCRREPAKAGLLFVILAALPTIAVLVTSRLKDRPQIEAAVRAEIEAEKDALLADAGFETTEGDPKKAVEIYTRVLAMPGGSAEAAGGLVLAHLKLKNAGVALELIDRHKDQIGVGFASRLLRADALGALGRAAESRAEMAEAPQPKTAFEHLLYAQKQMALGEAGDHEAFRVALHHVTLAALLSPTPRLSLLTLRAHAAGHLEDRAAIFESAAALAHYWPNRRSAQFWRGFALAHANDPASTLEALAAMREAMRIGPATAADHDRVGRALWTLNRFPEAIQALRDGLALDPNSAACRGTLATLLGESGRPDEARAEFEEAIRRDPNNAAVRYAFALALVQQRRFDDAMSVFREALRLGSPASDCHASLGYCLWQSGRPAEAEPEFREAVRLNPRSTNPRLNLAQVLMQTGRLKEAVSECRAAVRVDPTAADVRTNLADLLQSAGDSVEALAEHREAVRLAPASDAAHRGLGIYFMQAGSPTAALPALQEAARLRPLDPVNVLNLGIVLQTLGRFDEAVPQFREAIRLAPDEPDAYVKLGTLHCDVFGEFEEAEEAFKVAVRLAPNDVHARYCLGNAYSRQGRSEEAVAEFRAALKIKPDAVDPLINLGAVLCDGLGRYEEAVAAFREVIRLAPKSTNAHYNLGVALSALGKNDEAIAAWREALKLGPQPAERAALESRIAGALAEGAPIETQLERLREAVRASPENASNLNQLAWLLVDPEGDASVRDPAEAVPLARKAVQLTERKNPAFMDTLAAALFAHGDLAEAVKVQEEVVALMNGKDVGGMTLSYATGALSRYRKALAEKSGGG